MAACPLCVLGFEQPHSKGDWKKFSESDELLQQWMTELEKTGQYSLPDLETERQDSE